MFGPTEIGIFCIAALGVLLDAAAQFEFAAGPGNIEGAMKLELGYGVIQNCGMIGFGPDTRTPGAGPGRTQGACPVMLPVAGA